MATMKAFARTDADTLHVEMREIEIPVPGVGDVLVAVEAFGVGVHDRYFVPPVGPFPYTIGVEAAGTIVQVGEQVCSVGVGDRVMVSVSMRPAGGTWAEFVAAPVTGVTPIPDALDATVAAGIPVAGKSAVESLHTLGLREGDSLFVAGASGAIGTLVVQMASRRGIRVMGSASARNLDYLRSLGAEAAVDYLDPDWSSLVTAWCVFGLGHGRAFVEVN